MQHIETIELASAQSTIVFSSLPQVFDDLIIFISARSTATDTTATISFNTGGTYTRMTALGNGSTPSGNTAAIDFRISESGDTSLTFGNTSIYISKYLSSAEKSYSVDTVSENNATTAYHAVTAGLWDQTSAISSITLDATSGDFAQFTTASLYGVIAGGDGTVTTA